VTDTELPRDLSDKYRVVEPLGRLRDHGEIEGPRGAEDRGGLGSTETFGFRHAFLTLRGVRPRS
jgi:hypothetical protein